jgi:hypothetical protein
VDRLEPERGWGPETFSRVLGPAPPFHAVPFDDQRKPTRVYSGCTVFVDPARVTRADYDALSSCLAANALAIDRALGVRDGMRDSQDPAPQIAGTLYSRREAGYSHCGGATLGTRWDCAGGRSYLKTVMGRDGQIVTCPVTPAPPPGASPLPASVVDPLVVGKLSGDQAWIHLTQPASTRKYFATCRDSTGKTLFDTFKPAKEP